MGSIGDIVFLVSMFVLAVLLVLVAYKHRDG